MPVSLIQITQKRLTTHGGDTPELTFVPEASSDVKAKVFSLSSKLDELVKQEAAEESELEKTKREKKSLETQVTELEEKLKLVGNLKEILSGAPKDVGEKVAQLEREKQLLENQLIDMGGLGQKQDDKIKSLEYELDGMQRFRDAIDTMVLQTYYSELEPRVIELIKKHAPKSVQQTVVHEVTTPTTIVTKPPEIYRTWLERLPPTGKKLLQYALNNNYREVPFSEIALYFGMQTNSFKDNWLPKLRQVPGWTDNKKSFKLNPP